MGVQNFQGCISILDLLALRFPSDQFQNSEHIAKRFETKKRLKNKKSSFSSLSFFANNFIPYTLKGTLFASIEFNKL